jgi:hypothetical protein
LEAVPYAVGCSKEESAHFTNLFHSLFHMDCNMVLHMVCNMRCNISTFSTIFLRASFARGKAVNGNGIRRWPRMQFIGRKSRLSKNVEILAHPEEALTMPSSTSQNSRPAWGIASLAAMSSRGDTANGQRGSRFQPALSVFENNTAVCGVAGLRRCKRLELSVLLFHGERFAIIHRRAVFAVCRVGILLGGRLRLDDAAIVGIDLWSRVFHFRRGLGGHGHRIGRTAVVAILRGLWSRWTIVRIFPAVWRRRHRFAHWRWRRPV